MNLNCLNHISDDTRIIRFTDQNGADKSMGTHHAGELYYNFPLNRLHYYKQCEGITGDPFEGRTKIDFGGGNSGFSSTCNDALISCWSIWDGGTNPWESLKDSSLAKNSTHVIVSTVGKVKHELQKIILEINHNYADEWGGFIMNAIYGVVNYYSPDGIPHAEWKQKVDRALGIDIETIQNIFHKPAIKYDGQRFDAERECRFAIILNIRGFGGRDHKDIAKHLCYYRLVGTTIQHYIDCLSKDKLLCSS